MPLSTSSGCRWSGTDPHGLVHPQRELSHRQECCSGSPWVQRLPARAHGRRYPLHATPQRTYFLPAVHGEPFKAARAHFCTLCNHTKKPINPEQHTSAHIRPSCVSAEEQKGIPSVSRSVNSVGGMLRKEERTNSAASRWASSRIIFSSSSTSSFAVGRMPAKHRHSWMRFTSAQPV